MSHLDRSLPLKPYWHNTGVLPHLLCYNSNFHSIHSYTRPPQRRRPVSRALHVGYVPFKICRNQFRIGKSWGSGFTSGEGRTPRQRNYSCYIPIA